MDDEPKVGVLEVDVFLQSALPKQALILRTDLLRVEQLKVAPSGSDLYLTGSVVLWIKMLSR